MPPQSQPEPQAPRWTASQHRDSTTDWQPVGSEGQWTPPSAERRGRHAGPPEPEVTRRVRARHSTESSEADADGPATPPPAMAPPPPPIARHRSAEPSNDGAHSGGQSVAELLARLQTSPSGGGRRRRREE